MHASESGCIPELSRMVPGSFVDQVLTWLTIALTVVPELVFTQWWARLQPRGSQGWCSPTGGWSKVLRSPVTEQYSEAVISLLVGGAKVQGVIRLVSAHWWVKHSPGPVLAYWFSSVQFSHSVVSDSLQCHGLQHTRLPCPSPTPRVYSNSCLLHWWYHPTTSTSVIPFSSRLQSFPASGSFQMSQFFASGGQSIGVSASASVLPMNIQDWFPLGWTGWISLMSKWLSRVFSNTTVQKYQFFNSQPSLWSNGSHPYTITVKTIVLTGWTFVGKVMSMLFNILSRFVIAFLPRSKCLFISWLQSLSAVILKPQNIKSSIALFPLFPHLFAMKWWDCCHDLSFLNVEF